MRIALVAPHAVMPSDQETGCESGIISLAQSLARLGHPVTVYARKDSAALPANVQAAPGVTIEHVPAGPPARLPAGQAARYLRAFSDYLAHHWRQQAPDIVHAHFWTSGLATLAAVRGLDVPIVQTFHSLGSLQARADPDAAATPAVRARSRIRRQHRGCAFPGAASPAACLPRQATQEPGAGPWRDRAELARRLAQIQLEVRLARRVNAVLPSSSQEMSKLAGLGVPWTSMRMVPCGVDTGRFAPGGPVAVRGVRPRLITARHALEWAGLDIVIRTLAELPAVELLVVGGPKGDHVQRGLLALARKCGVAARVSFTGRVRPEDMPALLRSADLYLSTGREDEPFGSVALQAMACGTPVVAPALGIYEDAVIDKVTGILLPPGQSALPAQRVRRLLASPTQLEALGIAAADRVRARYSWDRIGPETVQAYECCLSGRL